MAPLFDVVRVIAIIVAFMAGSCDRRTSTATITDIVFSCAFAVAAAFFPQFSLPNIRMYSSKVEVGNMMVYLYREQALFFVFSAVLLYRWRNTGDSTARGAVLYSRVLGLLPLFISSINSRFTNPKNFSGKCPLMDVYLTCLWMSSLVQLIRERPLIGHRELRDFIGKLCRIEFLLIFLAALGGMAFPKMMVNSMGFQKSSTEELQMMRNIGCLNFGLSIIAWYLPSFQQDESRKDYFNTECLIYGLSVLHQLYCYWHGVITCSQLTSILIVVGVSASLPLTAIYLLNKDSSFTRVYNTRSKRY